MILKAIGLMSGTSMDGIDVVLLETDGKYHIKQKGSFSLDYDSQFKLALRAEEVKVRQAKSNIADEKIVNKSTNLHAEAVRGLLEKLRISERDIDLIGYHGQALYHNPAEGITIQIGNGQYLADLTKIKVINDFRSDDIKNGGQGAPLAPLYHQALAVRDNYFPVAVVNCGGIANISVISGVNENDVMGFDTGPGNVLLDRYIREKTNNQEFIDLDGKYGLKGQVNQEILAKLMLGFNDYLQKSSPKSLDPGDFILIDKIYDLSIYDACATLAAFTAKLIAESLNAIPPKWILAGGGWKNPVILNFLQQYLREKRADVEIKLASQIGWDSVYMEAEIFAYLAVRSFNKLPISLPKVTGASKPSLGGTIYYPQ